MNQLPEPSELWTSDPDDGAQHVACALRHLIVGKDLNLDALEWLLAVAEGAMDVGLTLVSAEITAACRRVLESAADLAVPDGPLADLDGIEGLVALRQGHLIDAERLLTSAAAGHARGGSSLGEALAFQNLATTYFLSDRKSQAREMGLQALRLHEQRGDTFRQAQTLVNLASYALEDGNLPETERLLTLAESKIHGPGTSHLRTSALGIRARLIGQSGDPRLAGELHRRVLRRARRTGDLNQVLVATQNLAAWYSENGRPREAARWLSEASVLAEHEGNAVLVEQLRRSEGVQLAHLGRLDEALGAMRDAVKLAEEIGSARAVAEGQADLAAILLNIVVTRRDRQDDPGFAEGPVLAEARSLLDAALTRFAPEDTEWVVRVLGNLATLDLLSGEPMAAIERLSTARETLPPQAVAARADLDRRAASIAVNEARRPDIAADLVRHAAMYAAADATPPQRSRRRAIGVATIETAAAATAWELALGAAMLKKYPYALFQAERLFVEAAEEAASADDDALLFHVSNDLAIVQASLGENEAAARTLSHCIALADRLNDRVMRQQGLANLGEIRRREGDSQAHDLLRQAASLAEDLEDRSAQLSALSNLALAETDAAHWSAAEETIDQAWSLLDEVADSADVGGQLLATRASVAAGRGDDSEAARLYLAAARTSKGVPRAETRAAAIAALGRLGDRRRYNRVLVQLARDAQREDIEGSAAGLLLSSADSWLVNSACGPVARIMGAAIELGVSTWVKSDWLNSLETAASAPPGEQTEPQDADAAHANPPYAPPHQDLG